MAHVVKMPIQSVNLKKQNPPQSCFEKGNNLVGKEHDANSTTGKYAVTCNDPLMIWPVRRLSLDHRLVSLLF